MEAETSLSTSQLLSMPSIETYPGVGGLVGLAVGISLHRDYPNPSGSRAPTSAAEAFPSQLRRPSERAIDGPHSSHAWTCCGLVGYLICPQSHRGYPASQRRDAQTMDSDVTPSELSQAVALLVREKTDVRTQIDHAREGNLRALYRMIRSVVAGNGKLEIGTEAEEDQAQDGESWELFRNEAKLQDGTLKIALPDFDAVSASERRAQEEDIVEQKMLVDESPAPIAFSIPTISAPLRKVYLPRLGESDTPRPTPKWLNGRLNSAAYEPPMDPHIIPPAASGHITDLGFGATVEGVGEGLIPLESPYAANLHPLPHIQHQSKHRHHRESGKRDRTRSDGQANGAVDNPNFGNWSFGVPPAYVQPSQRRQKVEAFQAQVGIKDQTDVTLNTINPVLANPLDASTSLSQQVQDTMEGKTITNSIHSSTLAPATRDIHALKPAGKPSDLYELGVGFRINPVSRAMKKTNKCVTSRDWQVSRSSSQVILSRLMKIL